MRKYTDQQYTDQPYYNVSKEYIRSLVSDYLYDLECSEDDFPNVHNVHNVPDVDDPNDNEYGGYWYKKGRSSQIGLIKFYEKFGFKEEPEIHTTYFGSIPYPSMICSI